MVLLSYHVDLNMDTVVTSIRDLFGMITGKKPTYKVHGGGSAENLALQNIQVCQGHCASSSVIKAWYSGFADLGLTCGSGSIEDALGLPLCSTLALGQRQNRRSPGFGKRERGRKVP